MSKQQSIRDCCLAVLLKNIYTQRSSVHYELNAIISDDSLYLNTTPKYTVVCQYHILFVFLTKCSILLNVSSIVRGQHPKLSSTIRYGASIDKMASLKKKYCNTSQRQ